MSLDRPTGEEDEPAVVAFSFATDVSTGRYVAFDVKAFLLTLRALLLSSSGFRPSSLETVSGISVGLRLRSVPLLNTMI
jgi:hypothetical protein